ncbi:hypothetical protein [uncultured Sunxiuqinia sp.]|uniref:hypothetical protein n=1 Tax=uncultured Sunxiuqinia sp. TaxID=1573825 RepID=UPI002AA71DAF|nr:hypothetical protein [uncultured Sunxiuqinia sp.]
MKTIFNNLPVRWILRPATIAFASYASGLSFLWCLLAYIGIIFLIEFTKNMIVLILGVVLVINVFLTMFSGIVEPL